MEKKLTAEDIAQNTSRVLSDPRLFEQLRMKLEEACRREGIKPENEGYESSLERYAKRLLVVRGLLQFELRNEPPQNSQIILQQLIETVKRNQIKPLKKLQKTIQEQQQGNLPVT